MAGGVLVVAAHPDDEVLGAGGTIARLARDRDVHVGILGEGATSRRPRREDTPPEEVRRLAEDARAAAKVLGVVEVVLAGLPDNRLDTVPLLDLAKTVEGWVARWRPTQVLTHHGGDLNVDHVLAQRAVLAATRPLPGSPVREVLAFEVPSATDWSFGAVAGPFRPNVFVDVASTLDRKVEALACYRGEARPFPHPRSPEALRAAAVRWGSVAGCGAAEAFELLRAVR